MAQQEICGNRPCEYSAWHRWKAMARYIDPDLAQLLCMVDVDAAYWIEYDHASRMPLFLVETALDTGQHHKTGTVIANLARQAGIEAYAVLYSLAEHENPADPKCRDIAGFRVKRLHPASDTGWHELSPAKYARWLFGARKRAAEKVWNGSLPAHRAGRCASNSSTTKGTRTA